MPAKAPIDENVKFLFSCLFRSDYKTIDFTRVAADFSINPAAARMRWSRLKKSINIHDIALPVVSPKKTKWPPKPPKEYKEPKKMGYILEEKEEVVVVPRGERSERKAKAKAEQKIGIVAKMQEEEEEINENADPEEGALDETGNKIEKGQKQLSSPGNLDTSDLKTAEPTFGLFQLCPSNPLAPVLDLIPTLTQSIFPAPEIYDETETEASSETVTIKIEPVPNACTVIGSGPLESPTNPPSLFDLGPSMCTSAPPQAFGEWLHLEHTAKKRRAGTSSAPQARKTRKRSRKSVDDGDEDEI